MSADWLLTRGEVEFRPDGRWRVAMICCRSRARSPESGSRTFRVR
jgi:hypothetical protein